jgi:hypothetical protein
MGYVPSFRASGTPAAEAAWQGPAAQAARRHFSARPLP